LLAGASPFWAGIGSSWPIPAGPALPQAGWAAGTPAASAGLASVIPAGPVSSLPRPRPPFRRAALEQAACPATLRCAPVRASKSAAAHRRVLAGDWATAALPRRRPARRASASSSSAPEAPPGVRRPPAFSSRLQRSRRRHVPDPRGSSLASAAGLCGCAHAPCLACPRILRPECSLFAPAHARCARPRVLPPIGWPARPLVSAARSPACMHARADSAVRPAAPACRGSALVSSCWAAPARP
jgi:hypothetical protein